MHVAKIGTKYGLTIERDLILESLNRVSEPIDMILSTYDIKACMTGLGLRKSLVL